MTSPLPILRILGGLFLILTALAYFLGVTIASSASQLFVVAGLAVALLALLWHRGRGRDVALFVIGLLVLSAFISPVMRPGFIGGQRISHAAPKTAIDDKVIDLVASTDVGGINVFYSTKSNLAYQVNFTRSSFPTGIFGGSIPSASLTNETERGVFILNATAHSYDISVAIGTGYFLNITASAGTGSIEVKGLASEDLGTVFLESGTGRVTANLTSHSVRDVVLQTGTGTINLYSNHFAPRVARVQVKLHASTGSVSFDVKIPKGTAVLLEASAGLGDVNQNLQGFSVSPQSKSSLLAQAGEVSGAGGSFIVQASAGTGPVTVDARFLA